MELHVQRPAESWKDFLEGMPRGYAPKLGDMIGRWCEWEERSVANRSGEEEQHRFSKDNGEERLYIAYVTGSMENAESEFFSMLTIRTDALMTLAVVPVIEELISRVMELQYKQHTAVMS